MINKWSHKEEYINPDILETRYLAPPRTKRGKLIKWFIEFLDYWPFDHGTTTRSS